MQNLIHRKGENMDNAVKAMGMEVERNFFTTVNTLLHENLVYAETMIKHLRFIGELIWTLKVSPLSRSSSLTSVMGGFTSSMYLSVRCRKSR